MHHDAHVDRAPLLTFMTHRRSHWSGGDFRLCTRNWRRSRDEPMRVYPMRWDANSPVRVIQTSHTCVVAKLSRRKLHGRSCRVTLRGAWTSGTGCRRSPPRGERREARRRRLGCFRSPRGERWPAHRRKTGCGEPRRRPTGVTTHLLRPGVLFDIDRTPCDTNYLHAYAWSRALRESGEWVPIDAIHRLISMGRVQLLLELLGHDSPAAGRTSIRRSSPLGGGR